MKNRITILILGSWLIILSLLMVACQTDSPAPDSRLEEAPTIQVEATIEAEIPTIEAEVPTIEAEVPTVEAEVPTVEAEVPTVEAETETVENEGPLVFHNGLVVTATSDEPIPHGAVVIENGLITAVGPEEEVVFPEGARIIDVQGGTILPGLIDARASDLLNRLEVSEGQISFVPLAIYLTGTLEGGVTTVRATGWQWEEMQNIDAFRAALKSHGNTVPTVIIAGSSLALSDSQGTDIYSHQTVGVGSVEEAREVTEQLITLGADQISLVQTVGNHSNDSSSDELPPVLSPDLLEAIVEVAHSQGKTVGGQAQYPDEAAMLLAAGVDELLSWPNLFESLPDELIQTLVADSIPVVSGFSVAKPQEGDVRRFLDAGGTVVFGSFAPNSHALSSPYDEFRLMGLNDMSSMEMIMAATANAAQAIGLGDVIGTLEAGKQADIITIDGDLFESDNLRQIDQVVYVVKGGELVVQPEED